MSAPNYVRNRPTAVTTRSIVIADHVSRLAVAPMQELTGLSVVAKHPCIRRGGESCNGQHDRRSSE